MKSKKVNTNNSNTAPTIGYNVERFEKNKISFTAFDMSGQYNYRELWNEFSKEADV